MTQPSSPSQLRWTDHEINERVRQAVHQHWSYRDRQAADQKARGVQDAGTRGAVTGGQHLNGFRDLLNDVAKEAGCRQAEYHHSHGTVLPGWYRATKSWDWVLVRNGELLAAVEFKSMVGSVGNNLNNRTEEVLGLSRDFWLAHERGLYERRATGANRVDSRRPFLGYVYLLGATDDLDRTVRPAATRFPMDREFVDVTYYHRFGTLCKRLVAEGDYTGVAFLKSRNLGNGTFEEPFPEVCFATFARTLYAHVRT